MEVLVHNISHADLLVSLVDDDMAKKGVSVADAILARPKFSVFQPVVEKIIEASFAFVVAHMHQCIPREL